MEETIDSAVQALHSPTESLRQPLSDRYRSIMFLPLKSVDKIDTLNSDWFVIDLQDSVPPADKDRVREAWRENLRSPLLTQRNLIVRVNELDVAEHLEKDLEAMIHPGINALLLPMLETAEDVRRFDELVTLAEKHQKIPQGSIKFICLLETPAAVINARDLATASARNIALSFGHADLLNCTMGEKGWDTLLLPRSMLVLAARAAQLEVIESPFFELDDIMAFEQQCERSKRLGFTGIFVLHPRQLQTANRVFSEKRSKVENAQRILSSGSKGCFVDRGTMLGPPFVKRLKKICERGYFEFDIEHPQGNVTGRVIEHTPELSDILRSGCFSSPYEVTITSAWLTYWHTLCFTGNPLEYNNKKAIEHGLSEVPIPFNLLLAYVLCVAVEVLTEKCFLHLSVEQARYHSPVYPGDTLHARISLIQAEPARQGSAAVLTTFHELLDTDQKPVFSAIKKTLFDQALPSVCPTRAQYNLPVGLTRDQTLRVKFGQASPSSNHGSIGEQKAIRAGELILHSDSRLLGRTENTQFNTLFRNTLPIHGNYARHQEQDIVTCGLLILPMVLGVASRDLKPLIDHEIDHCFHTNKVHPNTSLGGVSYIREIAPYNEYYDCVKLRTLGLKQVDVCQELANTKFPLALFETTLQRPRAVEDLCQVYLPYLAGKIVLVCDWTAYRPCQPQ